ncbi:MAG: hypothetical protein LQ351_003590 [Letrouitia transgressa]|nr:MAG: hypothetical protein LQ351_003590 [Letrouitia transgressa]
MAPIAVQNGKNDHAKTKSSEGSEPAIEVVATLVPWADKEERVQEEKGNTTQHQNSVISQFPSKTKIPQLILNLQLLSLFHSVAAHARSYEPDCTRYLIYSYPSTSPLRLVSGGLEIQSTRLKGSKIAIIERYNTQKAFEEHTQSDAFGKLAKALGEESLLAESVGGMEESWVQKIGGFE